MPHTDNALRRRSCSPVIIDEDVEVVARQELRHTQASGRGQSCQSADGTNALQVKQTLHRFETNAADGKWQASDDCQPPGHT